MRVVYDVDTTICTLFFSWDTTVIAGYEIGRDTWVKIWASGFLVWGQFSELIG